MVLYNQRPISLSATERLDWFQLRVRACRLVFISFGGSYRINVRSTPSFSANRVPSYLLIPIDWIRLGISRHLLLLYDVDPVWLPAHSALRDIDDKRSPLVTLLYASDAVDLFL